MDRQARTSVCVDFAARRHGSAASCIAQYQRVTQWQTEATVRALLNCAVMTSDNKAQLSQRDSRDALCYANRVVHTGGRSM